MTNILVTGAKGRMGQAIIQAVEENDQAQLGNTHSRSESITEKLQDCDVTIDFSVHGFTEEMLKASLESNKPLVLGTTGHTDEQRAAITDAAKTLPIVFAPNFSVGVNTLFYLTRKAAAILGNETFDIEVTEMHHRHKIDSPSGTARRLLEILNEETNTSYQDDVDHGRFGNIGPREKGRIGMHTLRGGDVVGDHNIIFAAEGERFEIGHKASSRMTFAVGSVRAALWLMDKPAGLYDMQDVLGLK